MNYAGTDNIFTPKGFRDKPSPLEQPTFPEIPDPLPVSSPASYPIQSSLLRGDESALVQQMITDVNDLMSTGLYRVDEIWPELIGAYYLDFYVAQVQNGGHSQFTHNAQSNFKDVLIAIDRALTDTPMPAVRSVFDAYRQWCETHPEQILEQTGFTGGRAAELDDLDSALYAALEKEAYPKKLAQTVSKWGFVADVAEGDYPAARTTLLNGNPNAERRKLLQHLNRLRDFFENPQKLAALLCMNAAGNKSFFLTIQNGAHYDFDGVQKFAWRFQHSGGQGYLLEEDDGISFHPEIGEQVSFPSFSSGATAEEMSKAFEAYQASDNKPRPGPVAGQVSKDKVAELHQRLKDGAYADLILAAHVALYAEPKVQGMMLGKHPEGNEDLLIVAVGNGNGSVFRVEVLPPLTVMIDDISQGKDSSPRIFEHGALLAFVDNLIAPERTS